jgi:hypothetical protein
MTKIKVHAEDAKQEPTAPKTNGIVYVTDAKGRKIGLKEPPFLAEFDIIDVVGPEKSKNQTYMGMLNPLLYIVEIDGEKVSFPQSAIQVRALIQQADRHGFLAALQGIQKHFSANEEELNEQIKNVLGTTD